MSSVNAPFGLRAAYHPSGTIRTEAGTVASAYSSDIYRDQPVKIYTDGTIVAAAATDAIVGAFAGVEWDGSDGRHRVSNFWPANTVGSNIVAYFTQDPLIIYEIQADGSIAQNQTGEESNFSNVATSNGLGQSTATISASSSASVAGVLRITGLTPGPFNAWGDSYTVVRVMISKHQFMASSSPF